MKKDDNHHSGRQEGPGSTAYTCPMHPEIRSSSPGACPKCGMTLVPVRTNEGGTAHHEHGMKAARLIPASTSVEVISAAKSGPRLWWILFGSTKPPCSR